MVQGREATGKPTHSNMQFHTINALEVLVRLGTGP